MSHRNMKEELTCPICMELFRQPRRLPCGHSYCYACLKAMLDRCTEYSGLYLDYSRSLVCPECREEVNIDSDRGVEMIPPDFKLSKLVDLFKFMKKNDSSDSSCDELQSCRPATPTVTSSHGCYGASTPAAAAEVISLPATFITTTTDQPTQLLPLLPPGTNATGTAVVTTDSNVQPRSTHLIVESSNVGATSATVSSPSRGNYSNADSSSSQATVDGVSSTADSAGTHNSEIVSNNTFRVGSPATVITNSVIPTPATSQSYSSAIENHLQLDQSLNASLSSERTPAVSHTSSAIHGRNSSEEFGSVSELGAAGGVETVGDNAYGLSVRPEQQVDSLEILSNWVNENHYYSQGSRNLSHSAVSLPAEVALEEAESCQENSVELNSLSVGRGTRAQSVPTETGEWNRSTQPGGPGERVVSKSRHNVKARKVKRGVFSRFVDSDTSSGSSDNDGRENQRSAGKPKRWLMTRFLRSIILSDSSSTDYSDDDDDDDDVKRNGRISKRDRTTSHSQQNNSVAISQQSHLQTDAAAAGSSQEVYHQRIPESSHGSGTHTNHKVTQGCRSGDITESQVTPQQHHLSASDRRNKTVAEIPGTVPSSLDSSTLAKEIVRNREAVVSSVDTLPKATHSCKSTRESENNAHLPFSALASCGHDPHFSEHRSHSFDTTACIPQRVSSSPRRQHGGQTFQNNLPSAGSPPTFYDNLNVLSDGDEGRTLHDNIGSARISCGTEGSQAGLVRDLRFDPCNQQQSLTSEHSQDRTLYDNIDSRHIRSEHTPTRPHHKHPHNRNPVTEIDDLKAGYEHFHEKNLSNIGADTREPDARLPQESAQHMGELDENTRCLSLSSQAAPHVAEHSHGRSYNFNSNSRSRTQHHPVPTGHVLSDSGDHPSFYDNINSHPLANSRGSAVLSNTVNHSEGGSLFEDHNARIAHRDGNTSGPHENALNTQGRHGDDELQHVDNYLDYYSGQFRNDPSLQNSATSGIAVGRRNSQKSGGGNRANASAETASSLTAGCGSQVTGATSSESRTAKGGNAEHDDVGSGVVDDDSGSQSGISMVQNKKPRSRLKKFLTSLLSLSSSSDDEIHHGDLSSSESSDW